MLSDVSIISWILDNGFVNEKGEPISFKEHFFLYDIYRDWSPEQVYKKAAQVGMTVTMTLKSFFAARNLGANIIYTLPSDDDVFEFVPTKVNKIIESNPVLGALIQTDKTELKQIGDRFIHFKGTRSKTAPIMTTADILVHDEKDRSEQPIIEQYQSRISRSKMKYTWALSNPSTSGNGVDVEWARSDKKEFFITCGGCKNEQFLKWEENVDFKEKVFICKHCGKVLTPRERSFGLWKPTAQGKVSGYHISQLMAPWIRAEELIEAKEKYGTEYFNNFVLGEPYDVSDIKISRNLITDLWTPLDLPGEQWYLGVDSGLTKHFVLGNESGITEIGKTEDWGDIEFLIVKYNPLTVIDALPDLTEPRRISSKYPRVFLNFYNTQEKKKAEMFYFGKNDKTGLIFSDRNRVIDALIDDMARGGFQTNVPGEVLKKYIEHWLTMRRIREENRDGIAVYKWESSSGMDHWVHATVYWWMARFGAKSSYVEEPKDETPHLIVETSEGPVTTSLKDYLEKRYENFV